MLIYLVLQPDEISIIAVPLHPQPLCLCPHGNRSGMLYADECVQEEGSSTQEGYFYKQEVYSPTRFTSVSSPGLGGTA